MYQFDPKSEFYHVGIFYYSDNPNNQFPGILHYSPDTGCSLNVMQGIELDADILFSHDIRDKTVHGFVENIGKVTLLNCFQNGGSTRIGEVSYVSRVLFPLLTVFGRHCDINDKVFTGISFHFPEMDSFCRFDADSYFINNEKPVMDCTIKNDMRIYIQQGVKEQIDLNYTFPEVLTKKIQEYINKETSGLFLTKAFYCINLLGKRETLSEYIKWKNKIAHMFSIFSLQPIHCDFLYIKEGDKSFLMIEKGDGLFESKRFLMPQLPITIHNIKNDFSAIFEKWDTLPREFVSLLIDRLYNNAKAGNQQYCMMIAAIASWQVTNGLNKNYNSRYEAILEENLEFVDSINSEIVKGFGEIFETEKTLCEVGRALGKIRDYFLHIDSIPKTSKKYDEYMSILSNENKIMNLCELLYIFMIKITYSYLGISLSDDQKENLSRMRIAWKTLSL